MRRSLLVVLIAVSVFGVAQEVASTSEIATLLEGATQEVLLAAPLLRSQVMAEALRQATVVRGVAVYLLVPDAGVSERASYALGLNLAGAALRLSEAVEEPFVVIDRATLVIGPLVGAQDGAAPERAVIVRDQAVVDQAVVWFYGTFQAAPPGVIDLERWTGGGE